jgi:hypothetical protein
MPRKRLTQTLLTTKTVPELVVLGFTPNDIAGAATKILSNKGSPGRRKHLPGNAISLWLAVELKRAFKGHKIKPASDFVAANVRKRCPGAKSKSGEPKTPISPFSHRTCWPNAEGA